MAANYYPILQAIKTIVDGLTLKDWNNNLLSSALRKLPKVDESIDTLPLLCIVPKDEPAKRIPFAFATGGPVYKVTYPCEVVAIAAGNRDFSTHLDTYMSWQSAIAAAFNTAANLKTLVPAVWDVNVRLGLIIDRAQVNDNYDYGGLTIDVATTEA